MLTPLAVLLPLLSDKFKRVKNYFLCVLILTITIESAQYIFKLGSFDIDDIILNVVGGVVGFLLYIALSAINKHLPKVLQKNWFYNLLSIGIVAFIVICVLRIY